MEYGAEITKNGLDAHTARQKVLRNTALSDKVGHRMRCKTEYSSHTLKKHSPQKQNHILQHGHKQKPQIHKGYYIMIDH